MILEFIKKKKKKKTNPIIFTEGVKTGVDRVGFVWYSGGDLRPFMTITPIDATSYGLPQAVQFWTDHAPNTGRPGTDHESNINQNQYHIKGL